MGDSTLRAAKFVNQLRRLNLKVQSSIAMVASSPAVPVETVAATSEGATTFVIPQPFGPGAILALHFDAFEIFFAFRHFLSSLVFEIPAPERLHSSPCRIGACAG